MEEYCFFKYPILLGRIPLLQVPRFTWKNTASSSTQFTWKNTASSSARPTSPPDTVTQHRRKDRFARIASGNSSQGSLRKDRFTSVQRIHHKKSKQLGETFENFSVASWSLPRTSSPTSTSSPASSSTPTSSFRHRHSDIVMPTSSFRHRHSDINAITDAVFCSSMAKDPRRGRDKVQKNLRARRNLTRTQFGPSPTHHRPRRLIEEARKDEATISFIKLDDSVLLVRLKGEVWGYDT